MKKILIGFIILITLLLAVVIAIPLIFKDDIKKGVNDAIEESVNADIDYSDLNITLFSNFPNLTVSLNDLVVKNKAPFKGVKLLDTKEISIALDIMNVIKSERISILGFLIDKPIVNLITSKDGVSNYDILLNTDETDETEEKSTIDVGINKWEIRNGSITIIEKTLPLNLIITNLNHTGKGDFKQEIFDLVTNTTIDDISCYYDGVNYLHNSKLSSDLSMNINTKESKYTFKENNIKLNDFDFFLEGWLSNSNELDMDVAYGAKEASFKTIFSLLPGVFTDGFESIITKGSVAFDGYIKGEFSDSLNRMPAFKLNLQVADAMFQYPDLPSAVENIAIDLQIVAEQDQSESFELKLNNLHLDMGENPIDAKAIVKFKNGYDAFDIDADIKAKTNLNEITQFYPIEGTTLKGLFDLDAKINGFYDSLHMPNTDAKVNLKDGYVKSKELPTPLEKLNFDMIVNNQSGDLSNTIIDLKDLSMSIDGEPIRAKAYVENLESPVFDVALNGIIDFEKLSKILKLEDMVLKGKMTADVKTKGTMKNVEAKNFGAIPTSGTMVFSKFYYSSNDLPQGFAMSDANFVFTPKEIEIKKLEGKAGKSDISITGVLTNYISYVFSKNEVIKGNMNFTSPKFDVNEWMTDDASVSEEEPLEVLALPKDIDFTLSSSINKVLYDNMEMDNMTGEVVLKGGKAFLNDLNFGIIGGKFIVNGEYDPTNISHPEFDFDLKIKEAEIEKAFKTFDMVKTLVPVAGLVTGAFSTDFKMKGELGQDMMPLMNSLSGKGLVDVIEAQASSSLKILDKIGEIAKMSKLGSTSNKFTSMLVNAEIKEGRLHMLPFDVPLAEGKSMNISGSNGVDGTLDYIMSMKVPTGQLGSALKSQLSGLPGGNSLNTEEVMLNMNMLGTHDNPVIKLLSAGNSGQSLTQSVTNTVKNTVDDAKNDAKIRAKAELEKKKAEQRKRIIDQANIQAKKIKTAGKSSAAKVKKQGYATADKLVKDAGANPIKKRIAQEAAKKMKSETDKKSKRITVEANKKADRIVAEAKKKAAKL